MNMQKTTMSLRSLIALATLLASTTTLGCKRMLVAPPPSPNSASSIVLEERFDRLVNLQQNWSALLPAGIEANIQVQDGAAHLSVAAHGEVALVRMLDIATVRGKRLRISARAKVDSAEADAFIAVAFGRSSGDFRLRRRTNSAAPGWTVLNGLVDVDRNILRADLSFTLSGRGSAWFDDLKVEVVGESERVSALPLSTLQIDHIVAFSRALALIRYRHPSDQAASVDWNTFIPVAIDRVIHTVDTASLLRQLHELFVNIAPTVEFSTREIESPTEVLHKSTDHLARWRHVGLGPVTPFKSWRVGRDIDQANMSVETYLGPPEFSQCKKSKFVATFQRTEGEEVRVFTEVEQGGFESKRFEQLVPAGNSTISLDFDTPHDARRMRIGVQLLGRSATMLQTLALVCDGAMGLHVDISKALWVRRGTTDLYSYGYRDCDSRPCLAVGRESLDKTFVPARDIINVEISDHLWIHLPLAVWSDGSRTFPEIGTWVAPLTRARTSGVERIAAVAAAWAALYMFYPSFADQHIDWLRELPPALVNVAAASSPTETYHALSALIAKLQDAHARVIDPGFPVDGLLPVTLRKFDDKIIVTGALGDYAKSIRIGSEVLEIDQVPALSAYRAAREYVSASTAGWKNWGVPLRLTLGPVGTLSTLRIRDVSNRDTECILPHISRDTYSSIVREPRPAFGTELAPNIRYVDLEDMKLSSWQSALSSLTLASALILDMRGYPSNVVFTMIGHFIDHELRSPLWQLPILETSSYQTSYWMINPIAPRLRAKLVILLDGRAASAAETFLQILQDNHLATFVGETSAGTNGQPNTVDLPGGFSIRFTGMRVPRPDGSALQGKGITPDVLVHPTLEGIRAGRDEILEAGIKVAGKLITN